MGGPSHEWSLSSSLLLVLNNAALTGSCTQCATARDPFCLETERSWVCIECGHENDKEEEAYETPSAAFHPGSTRVLNRRQLASKRIMARMEAEVARLGEQLQASISVERITALQRSFFSVYGWPSTPNKVKLYAALFTYLHCVLEEVSPPRIHEYVLASGVPRGIFVRWLYRVCDTLHLKDLPRIDFHRLVTETVRRLALYIEADIRGEDCSALLPNQAIYHPNRRRKRNNQLACESNSSRRTAKMIKLDQSIDKGTDPVGEEAPSNPQGPVRRTSSLHDSVIPSNLWEYEGPNGTQDKEPLCKEQDVDEQEQESTTTPSLERDVNDRIPVRVSTYERTPNSSESLASSQLPISHELDALWDTPMEAVCKTQDDDNGSEVDREEGGSLDQQDIAEEQSVEDEQEMVHKGEDLNDRDEAAEDDILEALASLPEFDFTILTKEEEDDVDDDIFVEVEEDPQPILFDELFKMDHLAESDAVKTIDMSRRATEPETDPRLLSAWIDYVCRLGQVCDIDRITKPVPVKRFGRVTDPIFTFMSFIFIGARLAGIRLALKHLTSFFRLLKCSVSDVNSRWIDTLVLAAIKRGYGNEAELSISKSKWRKEKREIRGRVAFLINELLSNNKE